MKQLKMNRRDFIKATAVTGTALSFSGFGSGMLVEKANAQEQSGVQIITTCCRNCTAECGVLAHVKDGRVIKLEGNPEFTRSEGALCVKGLSGIQALYNPNRNKYPMQRVGARGENKWKRVSWEEAIDKIARKLMEFREKYGAESVFASTGGGGNPNFMSPGRFCNSFDTPNWFEPGAAQCYLPRTLMFMFCYGGGTFYNSDTSLGDNNIHEAYDYNNLKTKAAVLWGTAPSYSGPSQAGRVLVENRARGVKTVVIDPRFTPDASKADVWLPIRPGTDVALGLAWIRYILENNLYDYDFCLKWTNMPYLVNTKTKMYLRESDIKKGGRNDVFVVWDKKTKSAQPLEYPWNDSFDVAIAGTYSVNGSECKTGFQMLKERAEPWTIKKAAETCWLREADIVKAIKIYSEKPSWLSLGVATDQNPNSTQMAHCAAILNIIMGNIEKPGAALQRFKNACRSPVGTDPLMNFLSFDQLKKRLGGTEFKGMMQWWTGNVAKHLNALKTGKPYKLKAWLERSGNKMGTLANTYEWSKVVHNLELIVHMYMYPTGFSPYADFLLPTNEWLETDLPVDCFNKFFPRQATTHLYETVNEYEIWAWIVKRCAELGHEQCKRTLDPKETAPQHPTFVDYQDQLDWWCKSYDMKWEDLKKGSVEKFPLSEMKEYYVYKQIDPKTGKPKGFNTLSKKCEIYLETLITLGRTGAPFVKTPLPPAPHDYNPLPFFIEPEESPNRPVGKEFPLVMTNGRLPFWHHITLRNIPYLREIQPVADIWVNPVDARKYGIEQSDWVWVESKRGRINARALVTEGIATGTVYMERFWNPENINEKTHGWQEMNVNVLSRSDAPYNEVVGTYTLRGYQVKIYKAEGAPKGVWTKPADFEPWMPEISKPTKRVSGVVK
jgi:anaerobic selenocysteine-containing dehydrogenase